MLLRLGRADTPSRGLNPSNESIDSDVDLECASGGSRKLCAYGSVAFPYVGFLLLGSRKTGLSGLKRHEAYTQEHPHSQHVTVFFLGLANGVPLCSYVLE